MSRSALLSMSISSILAVLSTACLGDSTRYSDSSDFLAPARHADDDDDNEPPPPKTKAATSTSAIPQGSTKTPPPSPSTSSSATSSIPPLATCDPAKATTKADCQKCCAAKPAPSAPAPKPATSCACGGGSKCGALCENSVCRGDAPDVACGICLLVAKCDPSKGSAPTPPNAVDGCQTTCNAKP